MTPGCPAPAGGTDPGDNDACVRAKRGAVIALLLAGACATGIACGQLILRSPHFRDAIGILGGRGHLLATAQGEGIYEADLQRVIAEFRHATGVDEKDRQEENLERVKRAITLRGDERLALKRLISNSVARSLAAREKISKPRIASELNLLRWQFPSEKTWRTALAASDLSIGSLRRSIAGDLRARQWITLQIASRPNATEDECRHFYQAHRGSFVQPMRFRATHLFLAAPPETPPEVAETKQQAIKSLSDRIKQGETLADLAAVESEDEATKSRGGDLGFFSEFRMPPDFFSAVAKMRVGETSRPIRTSLGFHIVQLTELKPERQMSFEEARTEVRLMIENEKRRAALQNLAADLARRAEFVISRF
jgi:parvulin-like peptidyl-prolyl isomerase